MMKSESESRQFSRPWTTLTLGEGGASSLLNSVHIPLFFSPSSTTTPSLQTPANYLDQSFQSKKLSRDPVRPPPNNKQRKTLRCSSAAPRSVLTFTCPPLLALVRRSCITTLFPCSALYHFHVHLTSVHLVCELRD